MIVEELNHYLQELNDDSTILQVVAGNVGLVSALTGGNANYMDGKIVASIVNLMEEGTLKNSSAYRGNSIHPEVENPPVYVNVFLLFSANPSFQSTTTPDAGQEYINSIASLTQVIEFFQGKRLFNLHNSPLPIFLPETPLDGDSLPPHLQDLDIKMELVSLTFEQINYLWGSLGGKQLPFVLYKAHFVPVKRSNLLSRGALRWSNYAGQ
jgi:hypothetical protein